MAVWGTDKTYLKINENVIPVEPSKGYNISIGDYEQVDKTEAGTSVRNLSRSGIPSISVMLRCDKQMVRLYRQLRKRLSLDVYYYDPEGVNDLKYDLMYMTNYNEKFIADIKGGGIWEVTFNLEDLEDGS